LCKLHKHALELEWSGGRRGQRQPEVGREGEGRLYHDTIVHSHYPLPPPPVPSNDTNPNPANPPMPISVDVPETTLLIRTLCICHGCRGSGYNVSDLIMSDSILNLYELYLSFEHAQTQTRRMSKQPSQEQKGAKVITVGSHSLEPTAIVGEECQRTLPPPPPPSASTSGTATHCPRPSVLIVVHCLPFSAPSSDLPV